MYIECRSIYNRSYNFHWNGGFANDHIANEARLYTPTTNWNVEMNHMSRKKGWEKLNRIYCHSMQPKNVFTLIAYKTTFYFWFASTICTHLNTYQHTMNRLTIDALCSLCSDEKKNMRREEIKMLNVFESRSTPMYLKTLYTFTYISHTYTGIPQQIHTNGVCIDAFGFCHGNDVYTYKKQRCDEWTL